MTTNQDRALNGMSGQRVNQILGNPYGDKTVSNYLNPAAFALPALGTLRNMGSSEHSRARHVAVRHGSLQNVPGS